MGHEEQEVLRLTSVSRWTRHISLCGSRYITEQWGAEPKELCPQIDGLMNNEGCILPSKKIVWLGQMFKYWQTTDDGCMSVLKALTSSTSILDKSRAESLTSLFLRSPRFSWFPLAAVCRSLCFGWTWRDLKRVKTGVTVWMDLCFCLKNGGTVLEIPLMLQSLLEGIKVNTYGIFQGQRKHGNIWRERSLTWSNFPLQLLPEPEFSQAFSPSYELHSSAGSPSAFLHICQHSTKMNGKNMELNHFEVHREAQQIMALVVGLQMFTLALQGKQAILDPM